MKEKSVVDLIFEKFAESIKKDDLFKGISDDLLTAIRAKKPNKPSIEMLLKRKKNENSES